MSARTNLAIESASLKIVKFAVDKHHIRAMEVEPGVKVYHLYPTLSAWFGREIPDSVNPRSHDDKAIATGSVPKAIEQTLRESPEDFYLANRGGTILADALHYDPDKQVVEIHLTDFEGEDARQGMADGATTDAVIARVQRDVATGLGVDSFKNLSPDQIPSFLHKARIHLEVIVDLEDRDRIRQLVQGRNTSKQVKTWTIADFKGDFRWIKDVLEAPSSRFKGRVGYEENAGLPVNILEVLAILTLFHRDYDQNNKAPTVAYSSKGRMDVRLTDPEVAPGYRALAPILGDILTLHDYIYATFGDAYKRAVPGGRLGRRGPTDNRIIPSVTKTLPLTGKQSKYIVPSGVLYPILASLRALVSYDNQGNAYWRVDPFKFYDKYGHILMENLIEYLNQAQNNPQTLGKSKIAYTGLYNQAKLLLTEAEAEAGGMGAKTAVQRPLK